MLRRQAIRGIWRSRRTYAACAVLMAVGVAIFVGFHLLSVGLSAATDSLYESQRFGDAFASVAAMPREAAARAAELEGVDRADATLVSDVRVWQEDSSRIVTLRVSSFDPAAEDRLNDFVLVEGGLPGEDGILISELFAEANDLAVGDRITLVLAGRRLTPEISGFAQSPEYVYAIPDSGQIMPDNRSFGFAYMTDDVLGSYTGRTGQATNLSLLLAEGVSFEAVKPALEDLLAPYGLRSLIGREDQPSHLMLDQELETVSTMASSFPMLFFGIAMVILYITLKRLIEQERGQIGVLKAFGFSNMAIALHYMAYGAAIGLVGGVVGAGLGVLLNLGLMPVFLEFFSLPAAEAPFNPVYLFGGTGIALLCGLVGAWAGARSMLRLTPSDAMRPPAPPAVRSDLMGRLPFLGHILTSHGRMSLRNVTRNRFRSAFVVLGVAVSFAITAFMSSYGEMFDALLFDQFAEVEKYNLKISLRAPAARTAALESAWSLDGVRRAEGMLELPVELHNAHRTKSVSLTAIQADSALYRIRDGETGETFAPPAGGLILSRALAEELGVGRGDLLAVKTPYTGDERFSLPVMGLVETNLGVTAYIELESLWTLLGIPPTVNGLILDAGDPDAVKELLWEADNVAAITDQAEAEAIYTDLLDTYAVMIYLLRLVGAVIAFAIIVNTATISLSERQREYATMRVLGMHPREIGGVIGLEYWLLFLVALPPGVLLTGVIKRGMAGMIDNDLFSIPQHTGLGSFVSAALLCGLAVWLSNRSARRKIAGFDMASVLKERE